MGEKDISRLPIFHSKCITVTSEGNYKENCKQITKNKRGWKYINYRKKNKNTID